MGEELRADDSAESEIESDKETNDSNTDS